MIELLRKGDNQAALTLLNSALQTSPRDCELLSLQAIALNATGQTSSALKSFSSALTYCPNYLPALEGAAQIQYASHNPEAAPLLNRILTLQPADATAHAMLAILLRSKDQCAVALPHFQASRPLFSSRPELLEAYGACLAQTGDTAGALVPYLELLSLFPNDQVRYNVALLQWKTHAPHDALVTLGPLLQGSSNEAALALASKASEETGDTPRAVELLRAAILAAPDHIDNYLDFADIAFAHQSFQVGIDMLNAGLKRQPDAAPLYVARGVLEVQLSQSDVAIADFERAHRLDPTLSFAQDAMGIMQSQQHRGGQSLSFFAAQATLHPDDPLLQYLLAEQLAEEAENTTDSQVNAAIEAAKRAVTLDPTYTAAHDLLAVLYLRAKQPVLAIEQAELALAEDPNDQNALYQEIQAKRRSGQTAQLQLLVARLNAARAQNERKRQTQDRYRLQDSGTK